MKQVTQHNRTGSVRIEEVPPPQVKPGHVLVQVRASLISAGTERTSVERRRESLLQRARRQPKLVAKLVEHLRQYGIVQTYRRVKAQLEALVPLGYSAAGVVRAVGEGVAGVRVNDRVACAGAGYATHAEFVLVPKNLCAVIPKEVEFSQAAYTTVGAIALQGVRQAQPTLGETSVVIGLGLLGQLTAQILKANGCTVIGVDLEQSHLDVARSSGIGLALHRTSSDVINVVRAATRGVGADAVIVTAATGSNDPLVLAGELCREKGRVVIVGDVGLELPREPYYRKELDVRLSRSSGPGRYDPLYEEGGLDYPISYVRWTERRNMEAFLRLLASRQVDVAPLTTHEFLLDEAERAYRLLTQRGGEGGKKHIGVLLRYEESAGRETVRVVSFRHVAPSGHALGVGFLGAGNFAQASLLPHVKRFSGASLVGVCTANGLNGLNVASAFGIGFATTDPTEVLSNAEIGTVFIATRHNLHARYIVESLNANKNVFVEKPLALNADELKEVETAYAKAQRKHGHAMVMVGFNRRFAPHTAHVKRFFDDAVGPYVMQYRVNAGFVPSTHWTRDFGEGGGRIIGEVCHFVDFMQFVAGARPVRVFAQPFGGEDAEDDSVIITIAFEDGSSGVVTYFANGDPAVPKEHIEIHSTQRSAVVDNFKTLTLYRQGKRRVFRKSIFDKGHAEEVRQFLIAVRDGLPSPIPFESVVTTTRATFAVIESLTRGVPVSV